MPPTNLEFFLAHARPGMIGLIGAEAPLRLMPSLIRALGGCLLKGGEDSAFSHVFLILDRSRDELGAEVITLAESTLVGSLQRSEEFVDHPGFPRWNGIQTSRLAVRHRDGRMEGQLDRLPVRRYCDEDYTPNVALVDPGLTSEQWGRVRRRVHALMADDRIDYGAMELVGTFWSAIRGRLGDANALDTEDLFCTAFLRECLDDEIPALAALEVHRSNTFPEHLHQAFVSAGYPKVELIRSPSIPPLHRLPCRLACELVEEWGGNAPAEGLPAPA